MTVNADAGEGFEWNAALAVKPLDCLKQPFIGKLFQILAFEISGLTPRKLRPDIPEKIEMAICKALAVPRAKDRPGIVSKISAMFGHVSLLRYDDAQSFANDLTGLYDPNIGTPLAIASVVRGLFPNG